MQKNIGGTFRSQVVGLYLLIKSVSAEIVTPLTGAKEVLVPLLAATFLDDIFVSNSESAYMVPPLTGAKEVLVPLLALKLLDDILPQRGFALGVLTSSRNGVEQMMARPTPEPGCSGGPGPQR